MPTVPIYDSKTTTAALPGPRLGAQYSSKGADAIGQGLQNIGEVVNRIRLAEIDKANKAAVTSAESTLATSETTLLHDPVSGALNQKGKGALDAHDRAMDTYDMAIATAEQNLSNDNQRTAFRQAAANRRVLVDRQLQVHESEQRRAYYNQEDDAYLNNEINAGIAGYRDPARITAAVDNSRRALAEYAERNGLGEDWLQQKSREAVTKVHSGVVFRLLANDQDLAAKAYYNKHADNIDPAMAERLQTALERRQAKREREIEKQISTINSVTLAGFEPKASDLAAVVRAAQGTALEPEAQRMVATAQETSAFRRMLPAQQAAHLTQLENSIRQDPAKFDITLLDRFRSIHENQQRALKESPVSFAVRQGLIDATDSAGQPLNVAQPDDRQLASRMDLARQMRANYGAEFKPLTPEESMTLSAALKQAPVRQKQEYFARLQRATGNDFEGYSAIMAQIAPDDPVTAIAGVYAARGRTQAADLMLRGQSILRPTKKEDGSPDKGKLWPMPPDTDLRTNFANYERDAFAGHPQARSDAYQVALAIYAARSAESGDASGALNHERWGESIRLATGGVERWNGKSLIMPYGMERGTFKEGLYQRIDGLAASGRLADGVNVDKLRDLPLEPVGDGRYVFRQGDSILVGKDGRPVTIDFTPVEFTRQDRAEIGRTLGAATAVLDTSKPERASAYTPRP